MKLPPRRDQPGFSAFRRTTAAPIAAFLGRIAWGATSLTTLALTAPAPAVAGSFAPLVLQDAQTGQGLTEFRSSNGMLDLQISAAEDPDDVNGGSMPFNPLIVSPDAAIAASGEEGGSQPIYPRLAFTCKDSTHAVTSFAGPLLRVQPGDTVRIAFTNNLITQRTNLHFHGLEISPHPRDNNGTFGDYVSLPYVEGVAPGNTRTYEFKIPLTQPPGPYWYHAHAHGVAEEQVACGLSGALYVEGAIPAYTAAMKTRFAPLLAAASPGTRSLAAETLSELEATLPQMPHALLVLKDFWTPGVGPILGPLEQSVNGKVTYSFVNPTSAGTPYVMKYGATGQLWEITNQSANLHYVLQFTGASAGGLRFYVLGRDGLPDASSLQYLVPQATLSIPPAGRATVIVPTDSLKGATVQVIARTVNTDGGDYYFQTGNDYGERPGPWNLITLEPGTPAASGTAWPAIVGRINQLLALAPAAIPPALAAGGPIDATYVLSEPPNPTPGELPPEPAQFSLYRLADSHGTYIKGPSDAYDNYEPPIARLTPGRPQRWIIENTSPEWHTFHLHQCHFFVNRLTEVQDLANPEANLQPPRDNDGNPFYAVNEPPPPGSGRSIGQPSYAGEVDTVTIPDGMQAWLTLPLNEGPQIAGEFVMHCHILEHEDGGMMANVVAGQYGGPFAGPDGFQLSRNGVTIPHLPPREVAAARLKQPVPLEDSSGRQVTSDIFRQNQFALVTFGYTTCQGACPRTLERCAGALAGLKPADTRKVSPFFVSLDVERDDPAKLRAYAKEHSLSPAWRELLDTKLAASRAFGARRRLTRRRDGSIFLTHTTTIYLIDRSLKIRAVFEDDDTPEKMSARIEREMRSGA